MPIQHLSASGVARATLLRVDDINAAPRADADAFAERLQLAGARLRFASSTPAASRSLAENYVGLPLGASVVYHDKGANPTNHPGGFMKSP